MILHKGVNSDTMIRQFDLLPASLTSNIWMLEGFFFIISTDSTGPPLAFLWDLRDVIRVTIAPASESKLS